MLLSEVPQRQNPDRRPSPRLRAVAARVRVNADRRIGKVASERIVTLSRSAAAMPTPHTAAAVGRKIADALKVGDEAAAFRFFLHLNECLAAGSGSARFALSIAEPARTGAKHWDAAIAGLVAFRLAEKQLDPPSWTRHRSRMLAAPWTVDPRLREPVDRTSVPEQFLTRGVLVSGDTLAHR